MKKIHNFKDIPKCCGSCAHLYKKCTEEPCMICIHASEWLPNENLLKEIEEND